jgi:serine/threonine-protein kinase
MTNFTGQDIGRYRIIEPLGQGGMATVYRAYDTHLECEVAVKFIRMERLSREEEQKTLKRFEREAKEIARLTHPNIVKVTDYGEYNGTPYLVMEYLPGGTLKQLAGKPVPYDQAARLLAPVARALEAAHQKNLIHRDIKPANILLTEGGQPMVSDFGIAKILGVQGGTTLTSTNVAIGTPEYMAPEQWLNQISAQSDIYSLGVVLYELVTGRKPYTADTPTAIFLKQSNDPLPRPRSFVPDLPEEVEKVLYKALSKKPEDRYASMGNFAATLEGLAGLIKPIQPPLPQVFETVTVRPEAPTVVPGPPELEIFRTEDTGQGIPASPSAVMGGTPPAESSSIPVSIPQKAASDRPSIRGWVWSAVVAAVLVGLVGLVGVLALIGWAVSKKPSSLPATQILQGLAVRQPTATTGLFMAPIPPTSTMTIGPTPALTPAPTQAEAPAATATQGPTPMPLPEIISTKISPKDGMVMVYVPAGEFLMGSNNTIDSQAYSDELPQHTVYLDAYWIDQTEVTNAQYAQCAGVGQCTPPYKTRSSTHSSYYRDAQYANYPVIYVDWNQAQVYCTWAGRRLPSEAEWEKAARGTDGRIYPWGDTAPGQGILNYNNNKGDTTAVGSYPSGASPYGALDMAGNVWEWVNDWYSNSYYQHSPARNPTGPDSGTSRVLRGGSWDRDGRHVRSAGRYANYPQYSYNHLGFRCAASP